jgi:hypothetical protein
LFGTIPRLSARAGRLLTASAGLSAGVNWLFGVADRLSDTFDRLSDAFDRLSACVDRLWDAFDRLSTYIGRLSAYIGPLSTYIARCFAQIIFWPRVGEYRLLERSRPLYSFSPS